jgi:ABC-type nitrate/sulfonate/bicarbonate transport system substrate-binding protein
MKKNFRILIFLLIVNLTISLVGCKSSSSQVDKDKDGLFTIRIQTQTSFNEVNVADELGFFKDEGIKIEYTGVLGQGVTAYQLLEQDINDVAGGHPAEAAQAILAGVDVVMVTPGIVDNPNFPHVQYLVQENSNIKSLEDIVGKKVGETTAGTCYDGFLKYYLKTHNVGGDFEIITLNKAGQQEQSLTQGLIDVTTSHPPYAGKALASGGVRKIATSWDIFHSAGAGLSCRGFKKSFIKEHPDVVQGFSNAMYKARLWINSHQDEAKQINAKYLNLDPKDLSIFWFDENKNIDPTYMNQWFEISELLNLWKKGDISPEDIYTNEFVPKDYSPK